MPLHKNIQQDEFLLQIISIELSFFLLHISVGAGIKMWGLHDALMTMFPCVGGPTVHRARRQHHSLYLVAMLHKNCRATVRAPSNCYISLQVSDSGGSIGCRSMHRKHGCNRGLLRRGETVSVSNMHVIGQRWLHWHHTSTLKRKGGWL